jgi:hypothetical protein
MATLLIDGTQRKSPSNTFRQSSLFRFSLNSRSRRDSRVTQISDPDLEKISSLLKDMYASVEAGTKIEKDEGLICLDIDLFLDVSQVTIITYIFSDSRGAHYFKSTKEALDQVQKWYVAQSHAQRRKYSWD